MDTFTLTAGDASASVTLPPTAEAPFDQDDDLRKQRTDTSFKFEVAFHGEAPVSAEALIKKTRSDTNFKFERLATPPDPDADSDLTFSGAHERAGVSLPPDEAPAMAGRKRQDTNFSFEVTTRGDSADDAADSAEALGGRIRKDTSFKFEIVASDPDVVEALGSSKRKDTNFHFERTATPTDPGSEFGAGSGLTTTETQERVGSSDLAVETADAALEKRHDTSFSFEVYTPVGGAVGATVRVSVSEADDE